MNGFIGAISVPAEVINNKYAKSAQFRPFEVGFCTTDTVLVFSERFIFYTFRWGKRNPYKLASVKNLCTKRPGLFELNGLPRRLSRTACFTRS